MTPSIDPKLSPEGLHDLPTPDPESTYNPRKPYRFSTLCATVENPGQKDQYGSSSVPIYQTATFKGVDGDYDYSRSGNPTRSHLGEPSTSKDGQATRFVGGLSPNKSALFLLDLPRPRTRWASRIVLVFASTTTGQWSYMLLPNLPTLLQNIISPRFLLQHMPLPCLRAWPP